MVDGVSMEHIPGMLWRHRSIPHCNRSVNEVSQVNLFFMERILTPFLAQARFHPCACVFIPGTRVWCPAHGTCDDNAVGRKHYTTPSMRVCEVGPACLLAGSGHAATQGEDGKLGADSLRKDSFWAD